MTAKKHNIKPEIPVAEQMLKHLAEAAPLVEIQHLKLISGTFDADAEPEPNRQLMSVRVQFATDDSRKHLTCRATLEFFGTPRSDHPRAVEVTAHYELQYVINSTISDEAIDAFARINSVYNAWPYWREHLQTTLTKLGLPVFTLPLIRIQQIVSWVIAESKPSDAQATPERS